MFLDLLMVAGGLTVLLVGAWQVVRSAVVIALAFGLSRVVIGATVVAFGTSAPEFVISLAASVENSPGLAVGNVVGSNVANIALVLGAAAVLSPMAVSPRLLRWEIPVLIAATAAVLLAGADGSYARWEGFALFGVGLVGFILLSLMLVPEPSALAAETPDVPDDAAEHAPSRHALLVAAGLLVAGLAALAVGAAVAVEGATGIAERIGMSDLAIGVTIVAVGTSLPEIATTLVAALRREHDIAVANAVGSNIFNLLGVIGGTALIAPFAVDRSLYQFEMIALAASSLVLIPIVMFHTRSLVDRREGIVLLVAYVLFLAGVVARA
jgi:cation:H+ antiporter